MRRQRTFLAAVAVSALVLLSSVSSAVALPSNFWGVVPQGTLSVEQMERLKRGGVTTIRVPISWAGVQRSSGGPYDFSGVDAVVATAAAARVNVLPFVFSAPPWAVPQEVVDRRHGASAPRTLPVRTGAQRAGWSAFVSATVARYGPNGSFWAENPALAPRPMRTWQIWNEPNFMYFVGRPNPRDYGKLVKISNTAIKAVDPRAKLVLGGLFAYPKQATFKSKPRRALFATEFLQQLYRTTPGIKSKFDAVALHPYSTKYQDLDVGIEAVRKTLKANRDPGVDIWITELGWSSGRPSAANGFNSYEKGPSGQAKQLKGAYTLLLKHQVKWRIKSIFWYSVDDNAAICNFCDGSGLFGPGFAPKPAWSAFVRFTGGSVE
jgi:hypothetical protein